jgi:formamidopyrimidine-DNA glycosylase
MPELPEVETIKSELAPCITGHHITAIAVNWARMVCYSSVEEFCSSIIGRKIKRLGRLGKYLLFFLDGGGILIIHLRMSGSLLLKPISCEPDKYVRAIIDLDGGVSIHFRDPRKFGVMWFASDLKNLKKKLGPEPLDNRFTSDILAGILEKRKAPIKALLLDQNVIAGIGNMYADEALFSARIHPLRPGGSLTLEEIKRLHKSIREVLTIAIEHKGASVNTYYRPGGEEGIAHSRFQVAHRLGGKLCPVCSIPLERSIVRNRGSYFCPGCQPVEKRKNQPEQSTLEG